MFIDIHVHASLRKGGRNWPTPEELIETYDRFAIDQGVILPIVSPECSYGPQNNEEILEICEQWPDRFIPFCNVDPRFIRNSPDAPLDELLRHFKERGCKGVGEITANLPFNDPKVENLFKHCEALGMPVLFHVAPALGGYYGLYDEPGLPLLEGVLRKFPNLVFLGHSGDFWCELGAAEPDQNRRSARGPVKKEGAVVRLMREYPNLHGDLSAGSGFNAVSRDPEFSSKFLQEFQDRLYFGTDITGPHATRPQLSVPLPEYLRFFLGSGRIPRECFDKISRKNAMRLLDLKEDSTETSTGGHDYNPKS